MTVATPIATRYNGYRFRSRLEARWAVFFDHAGIDYRYETQGFTFHDQRLGRRTYLPDFFLPGWRVWVEVKGASVRAEDVDRIVAAVRHLPESPSSDACPARGLLLLRDFPDAGADLSTAGFALLTPDNAVMALDADGSANSQITNLTSEDAFRVAQADRSPLVLKNGFDITRLASALDAGRTARFEHGETPSPPREQDDSTATSNGIRSTLRSLFSGSPRPQCGTTGQSAYKNVEVYCDRSPEHSGKHKGIVDTHAFVWGDDGVAW